MKFQFEIVIIDSVAITTCLKKNRFLMSLISCELVNIAFFKLEYSSSCTFESDS